MKAGNGQYEIKESFYHLEISCRYIAEKFGKPVIADWTNGDYIRLSSILLHATSVQISPNTLKRIFGKLKTPERYYPQKATRDALVQYIGFKDWEGFVITHPKPDKLVKEQPVIDTAGVAANDETKVQSEKAPSLQTEGISVPQKTALEPGTGNDKYRKQSGTLKTRVLIYGATAILALALVFVGYQVLKPASITTIKGVNFTCKNPEGRNPHSAVFKLQIPEFFSGDLSKFTVSFGDGRPDKPIRNSVVITHYYEIPGRYYATLKYDETTIDTIPIYLRTDGWTATATVERDSVRVYPVSRDSLFLNHYLSASSVALRHAGVDTNKTFYVNFVNTQPTKINGDNFELTCKINTSPERAGVRCSQLMTIVYGEKAFHKLFFLKPGCEAFSNLTFSEFHRSGHEDDLNFLGADLSSGGELIMRVQNKNVSIRLNGTEIYTASYTYPLGKIYGLKIAFAGVGKIHDVTLKDLQSGDRFADDLLQ